MSYNPFPIDPILGYRVAVDDEFAILTDDNYLLYAAKCYNSPHLITAEFEEDVKRLSYLQKLFFRYYTKRELKERLILNHIIVLYNTFGVECAIRMMFLKLDRTYYSALKTFLLFLDILPEKVSGIEGLTIHTEDVKLDLDVLEALRKT